MIDTESIAEVMRKTWSKNIKSIDTYIKQLLSTTATRKEDDKKRELVF